MAVFDADENAPSALVDPRGPAGEPRMTSTCLATATLAAALITAAAPAVAEPGVVGSLSPTHATVLVAISTRAAADAPLMIDPTMLRRAHALDGLMAVRGGTPSMESIPAGETDQAIATAVARGLEKDLVKKSGFRKKHNDFFRAERQVRLGDQELEVRLRVQPKTRNTMKVELRF